jgi:hypothetical protein
MPRGRTRTITSVVAPIIPGQRMPPPPELSAEQATIWDRIIGALPQGWITDGSAPLLVQLARHIDFSDRLSRDIDRVQSEIAALESEPADDAKAEARKVARVRKAKAFHMGLLRAHGVQSNAIGRLSQKLRLTKLSQYMRSAEAAAIAARNAPAVKPWEGWESGGGRSQ